jgi:hypothetical protein
MIKYYTVYKVTNKINGKVYIGTHKTNDLDDDYMGSGKYLKYSQNKHGMENFEKEILHVFDNPEEMFAKEKELVNEEFIAETNTYNLKIGGFGGWDFINTSENIDFVARNTQNCVAGGVAAQKNITSDERSRRNKLGWANGNRKPNFRGKTHSEETKHKMSETAKERLKDPTKNSQYGSIWIYSLEEQRCIKIKKDDDIPEGWLKGRKMKFNVDAI